MKLQFGELNITPTVLTRLDKLGFDERSLCDAIYEHKSDLDGNPSVYCGTYSKYNDGSLCGLWIDLSTFTDYDEFITFCQAIHADEADPELMFQDYEAFPREWYCESCPGEDIFNKILDFCALCLEYDTDAVDAYFDRHPEGDALSFREAYCGHWYGEEDFARHIIEECYDLEKTMGDLARYFDYEAFARELFMFDYYECDGYVFRA